MSKDANERLRDLGERVDRARAEEQGPPPSEPASSPIGLAFRFSVDVIAAVVVGIGAGWLLDRWLGTAPYLLIVMFFLGAVAGFLNVIRTASRIDKSK